MSVAVILQVSDEKTKMAVGNCGNEEKNINHGLCMCAGIETPDNDQRGSQRRHFPNKMSSNIFFSDCLPDDNASSENNADEKDLSVSAGTDTRHADQKQLEQRHFDAPPEDCMQLRRSTNQGDQVDQQHTERQHFESPEDSMQLRSRANEDDQVDSAGTDTCHADQKELERRHFDGPPEDCMQLESSVNQNDQEDKNYSERRHFDASPGNFM